jgi:hypothetical protein
MILNYTNNGYIDTIIVIPSCIGIGTIVVIVILLTLLLRIMGPQMNRWGHVTMGPHITLKGDIVGKSTSQEKITRLGFEPRTSQIYTRCSNH